VAQLGSALDWGSRGRGFKSRQPDHYRNNAGVNLWTIPNLVSFLRLLGIPALLYFGLVEKNDAICFWLFVAGSVSDWLDGFLARKLNQQSEFGAQLDPIADRLYIVAALVILLLRNLLPIWVPVVIVARELFMACVLVYLNRNGFARPEVHYVGKAGTLMLLYSVPFIFLGNVDGFSLLRWFGLAWLGWGIGTYWVAGWLYARQARSLIRA
jgi:cardiolipin synthase